MHEYHSFKQILFQSNISEIYSNEMLRNFKCVFGVIQILRQMILLGPMKQWSWLAYAYELRSMLEYVVNQR